jgi:hypothetical protein
VGCRKLVNKEIDMKKRFFAVLAVIGLALCSVPTFAQTEADFTVGLTDDGEGVVIEKYNGKAAKAVIPAKIQGMPVREIGDRAFKFLSERERLIAATDAMMMSRTVQGAGAVEETSASSVTSVVIPSGVIRIGNSAFSGQGNLVSVTIPPTVTAIGDGAFAYTSITQITLPAALKTIGKDIFSGCSKLAAVTIPEGFTVIGENLFAETAITAITIPSTVSRIAGGAFANTRLKSITLPPGITKIEGGTFSNCSLTSIIIPEGVTEIESGAFSGCGALASLTLPSTIKKIAAGAFRNCSSLITVTIPDSVETISMDNSAFTGCPKVNLASQAALKKRGYTGRF